MGCANTKAGGATAAYGAPEEEGGAPPKAMVDGEGQDGAVAVNGNAVACANGVEEETSGGGEAKEDCNGGAKNDESEDATSGGGKADENAVENEEAGKSIQDGGPAEETEDAGKQAEDEAKEDAADSSENAESRDTAEEDKPE